MDKVFSFDSLKQSSQLIRDYINNIEKVTPFFEKTFSINNIIEQADELDFPKQKRELLSKQLKLQNSNVSLSKSSKDNIDNLKKENAYTVTTGHQLNLATGPLYTLYKIIEVINTTEKLNEFQNEKIFIPVYWMATEDHDFDEINHVNLYNSKIEWPIENSQKVVGRIETNSMGSFKDELLMKFSDETIRYKVEKFLSAYDEPLLASANRKMINNLFGDYGLVIIDGDDIELKKQFSDVVNKELLEGLVMSEVEKTNHLLKSNDYQNQVFVRPVNLFYIEKSGNRIRIEKDESGFKIGNQSYNEDQMLDLVREFPGRISPNALLRPVYQELVLPNTVYVGGGGEIAYWLQLKGVFQELNIKYPILKVRDSVLLMNEKNKDLFKKFDYSLLTLKSNHDDLSKDFVLNNMQDLVSLEKERTDLFSIKADIIEKANKIDPNSSRLVEAEFQKIQNQFDKLEKKFIQAEKKKSEKDLNQLKRLQNSIYPQGGFQERFENYLNYVQKPDFIAHLKMELKERMTEKSAIHVLDI